MTTTCTCFICLRRNETIHAIGQLREEIFQLAQDKARLAAEVRRYKLNAENIARQCDSYRAATTDELNRLRARIEYLQSQPTIAEQRDGLDWEENTVRSRGSLADVAWAAFGACAMLAFCAVLGRWIGR